MNFREAFTDDLEGFLDIEEFAQIHLIEGSEVKAIVKNVSNSKRRWIQRQKLLRNISKF